MNSYDQIQSALLNGRIDECDAFLASRHDSDKGTVEYWYWLAQMYYRSGRHLQALDIFFKISREAHGYGMHFHCIADICGHLGIKDIGLTALDTLAAKPEFSGPSAYHIRIAGYHYLGEDDAVLTLQRDASTPFTHTREHYRGRSMMRSKEITAGVREFHQTYCSREAVTELWPHLNADRYWNGQLELPKRLSIDGHSSGYGDFVQWARYAQALQALGVEIVWDTRLNGLLDDYKLDEYNHHLSKQLVAAGFFCSSHDTCMWTDPFTLFASLFPVLGYATTDRYIESHTDTQVEQALSNIRRRAQGRRCVGLFWSSCESTDLYARKSMCHTHLDPLFEASDDIHWVVMQRGYERTRWINNPRSKDSQRSTPLPEQLTLRQAIGVMDRLDGFVGNDGVLSHAAGALNKPGYLLLNSRCADWRYEQSAVATPWYTSLEILRPDTMGNWDEVTTKLASKLDGLTDS
ncbi:hypothetical protein HT746_06995 [Burkholderia pyrrocinia]|uniref:hypothetical protein n=1 Tax=Burkholderia pyrrocinia TaxID=60550 RepID=UPI0015755104|nr:hypothetical protein [Burkholderia pyrrocinia]NTX26881.1 hypothetical protein [Burkholderia pyrrocinia]